MFLEQKGLEISFKEREGGTVTEGLRKGVPEFGGHGAERPASEDRKSGAVDREEIWLHDMRGTGWSIRDNW